jgi:hypothetical protein
VIKHVKTGYKPRIHQAELHARVKRFNAIAAHRRFGKGHFAVNECLDRGLRCTLLNPQYAYLAPTYGAAKRIIWDIFKQYTKDIPGIVVNEAELRIDIPRPATKDRVRFMLLGAENPDYLRGIYLDGVVLDEYSVMDPVVWSQIIRPALSDRIGWAIFISTPKGMNHFYRLLKAAEDLPDWHTAIYKASETGIIPQAELDAARQTMSEEEYMQEYECSFAAALVGAYYGKEMERAEKEGRVTIVPYDKAVPVYTYWDLGMSDTTAIWFAQRVGGQIRFIDYHEEAGQDIAHYAKILKQRGYYYEEHVLPHDAKVRELGTGKTRQEVLKALCPGVRVRVLEKTPVADGINACRLLISKSIFDKTKCNIPWGDRGDLRGIESLKQYEKVWDSKNGVFQNNPKHNWCSHGADAFRTAAMGMKEHETSKEDKKKYPRECQREYSVI